MLGKTLQEVWPEVHPVLEEIFTRVLSTGEPYAVEDAKYLIRRSPTGPLEGRYFSWYLTRVPLPGEEGWGLLATCIETTERVLARAALDESRAMLEAALASMTDAVFISDAQGRFLRTNDAFVTYHRFRSKEECSKALDECRGILNVLLSDGTPAPVDSWAVPRALRGETASNVEYTLQRKDTGETWVGSYSFGPIRGEDGSIVGSVVVARDITERKQVEEALRDSHHRLEARVRERTAELNKAVQRDEPCEICETYSVLKTMAPHRWEWTGPDGRRYDIFDFPFRDADGSTLILEMGLDITECKRQEAELAKYREHLVELVREGTRQLEEANARLQAEIAERKQAEAALRESEHD